MSRPTLIRAAGLNERRCIARHDLGFYGYLVVGAIYTSEIELDRETLAKVLKHCIDVHPVLSAGIRGAHSETPEFVRPAVLNVHEHLHFLEPVLDGPAHQLTPSESIKQVLRHLYRQRSPDYEVSPPWCVGILPLVPVAGISSRRTIVGFAYSHSHGDGASGLAFHRAFARALDNVSAGSCPYTSKPEHPTCTLPMPPPLELAGNLSISWSFLLGPLLGEYVPKAIAQWLGLDASASIGAWRASLTFYDPGTSETCVEVLQVPHVLLMRVLAACHAQRVTFTGLMHQLIVRALSQALPADTPAEYFVTQTAIDLRRHLVGITSEDMGVYASGASQALPRRKADDLANLWDEARSTSLHLAQTASSLHNQPVGLLSYLNKVRPWLTSKIGKPRGASYELSNIMAFDVEESESAVWRVGEVFFSQPFDAIDCPVSFNVVSRKGGDLVLTLSWQSGALDVADEIKFSQDACSNIRDLLEACSLL